MKNTKKTSFEISIVVPFYNESASVRVFFEKIIPILHQTKRSFEIVCVNDGSRDDTFDKLLLEKKKYNEIKIINFSRN